MSTPTFTVHPAADLFPMMSPEELQELAADIQENGLDNPVMLDPTGKQLIDGRNRLAACKLLNIEPKFAKLPASRDLESYIVSQNLKRRHITKGQQAMATAMIYPDTYSKKGKETLPFSKMRLAQARSVLHHSRPLALSVVNGSKPLDQALAEVKQAEQYQMGDEAKLTRLREAAPDLAEQVNEERLKLDEAIAAMSARQQRMREVSESAKHAAVDIVPVFVTSAFAIQAGLDQGDKVIVKADQMKLLADTMKMLLAGQTK